tara:strand:+ start:1798 stop:2061 length:264 start_codon:yes stop_codon:yes gene_type:complete
MALKKQSIRTNQNILANDKPISKDELITESENWSEMQENFFRKMLKQGGTFKVNNIRYKITLTVRNDLDSKGNKPLNLPPMPGERTF